MVQTGSSVGVAFALSIGAGLSTCIGGLIVFFKQLVHLASPKTLSVSLSLSAGVMIFISLVEIFGKSVESYQRGFGKFFVNDTTLNCSDPGVIDSNKTENITNHCIGCDNICVGNSWLAATGTFVLGVLIIFVMDYIVGILSPEAHEELEISHLDQLQNTKNTKNGKSFCCVESGNSEEGLSEVNIQNTEVNTEVNKSVSSLAQRQLNRTGILTALAIGLHNLPEGVATYVGAIGDTRVGAALAVGIGLHNIPEGIAVAAPVYFATGSRLKAFMWSFISALAEPVGAIIAWLIVGDGLNGFVEGLMFGIVSGMMVTISFKELIPNAIKFHPEGNSVIYSILGGMGIMSISLILFAYVGV